MAKHKHEQSEGDPVVQEAPAQTPPPAATVTAPKVTAPKPTLQQTYDTFQAKLAGRNITLVPAKFKSVGLDVTVSVPTSVSDFDTLAEKDGACLGEGIKNVVYRGALAVFRNEFCEALETKTGIKRTFDPEIDPATGNPKVDTDGDVVVKKWEPEAVYVKRVAGDNPEQFQSLADSISALLTFDPTAPEPKAAGTKKMAQVYITTATQLFDQGRGEKVISNLVDKLGVATPADAIGDGSDKDARIAILAGLIKEDQSRKKLVNEYAS